MKSLIREILKTQFNITDIYNFDFKLFPEKKVSTKNVRGSVRSQLGKFLSEDQFNQNKQLIEENPLP